LRRVSGVVSTLASFRAVVATLSALDMRRVGLVAASTTVIRMGRWDGLLIGLSECLTACLSDSLSDSVSYMLSFLNHELVTERSSARAPLMLTSRLTSEPY